MPRKKPKLSIRAMLFASAMQALLRVRSFQNGLKLAHISVIVIVGSSEGLTCAEYGYLMGLTRVAMFHRLRRLCGDGFSYKDDKRYYLTDSGKKAYSNVNGYLSESFKQIESELLNQARNSLLGQKLRD